MLADMDHERSENLERSRLEREKKKLAQDGQEASRKGKVVTSGSTAFDGDEDIALVTAFAGELGHIVEIDEVSFHRRSITTTHHVHRLPAESFSCKGSLLRS